MLKLRRHHPTARLQMISDRPLSLLGPASFLLQARPQDDGAMWPALATRCRRALPAQLQWAAPLLDAHRPLPVLCAERQVEDLFHWLNALPNTERVSIGCQQRTGGSYGQRPL
jgi:hypothetical protein